MEQGLAHKSKFFCQCIVNYELYLYLYTITMLYMCLFCPNFLLQISNKLKWYIKQEIQCL